jgi:tape measure domain-containing protein
MATGSGSRDVTLTLTVDTLGEEGIKQLQTAISSLAGAGTSAGPEFQKLADQITRLGEQNTALQTVKTLAEQTDKLAQDQEAAAQKAQELATRLDTLKQSAAAAAQKQIEAKDAVNEAKKASVDYTAEIIKLRSEFDAAGKKTDEYKTKFKELTDKQAEAKKEIIDLRDAQKAANVEYNEAQSSVSKLTKEYERESAAANTAVQVTNEKRTALNSAVEQANKLGVATDDLTASEGNLIAVFNRGVTAVNERKAALAEMAESDKLLAIQEQAQIELLKRGEQALQAEVLALRDAERSIAAYTAEKAKATADEQAWQREAFAIVEAKEAAQKLARETQILTAAQNELAQQNAFEKLANEAKKMADAADYVRFWETELAKAEQQVRETANAASAASVKIQDAFKTVGVRSAQELKEEIAKTKAAMETLASESTATGTTLKGAFDAGNAKINALERDLRELNGTMTLGDKTAKLFSGALGQIAAGNLVADGVGYLVQKVKDLGAEFVQAVIEGDKLRRGLNAIYGSTELATKQMDFLRQTAMESGVSMGSLTGEFVKFAAAMKSANIPLDQSNELFKAVTRASATLGLSADETSGALNALAQMASKGTVSMEELRQQLGDRLPGAMGLVAQGLGITEAQLNKLVETGNLAARDLFPALAQALNKLQGETDGVSNAWERFKGFLTLTAQTAGDAGWVQLLTGAIKLLGSAVGAVGIVLMGFYEALQLTVKGAAALFGVLTGDSAKTAWEFLKKETDDSATRLRGLHDAYGQLLDPQQQVNQGNLATGTSAASASAATQKLDDGLRRVADAHNLSAAAASLAGDATLQGADKIVPYNTKAAELIKSQQLATEGFQRQAKAAEDEGKQLVTLAQLTGDHSEVARANAQASQLQADALEKIAESQQTEVDLMTVQITHIRELAEKRGATTQQIEAETKAYVEKLAKAQPELEQVKAAAEAAREEAFARSVQTQALQDHSKEIGGYSQLLTQLRETESNLVALQKEGFNVSDDLKRVREQISKATALYNDGIKDLIRNTDVELKQTTALAIQQDAQAGARVKHLEVLLAEAKQQGLVNDVTKLENQIKTENIKILESRKLLIQAEIEAGLKIIDAKRAELTANTDENEAKRKLLDVEEKLLLSRKDSITSIDEQIKGLKNSTAAVEGLTEAYHQLGIKTPQELQQIAEKNAAAWEKVKNDGQASISQLQTAFEKYAQSAIDAAGDMGREVTEQMLKSEGATRGLNVAIDATGKVSVEAMGKAASAINNARGYMTAFERSAIAATEALEAQNAAVERRISALEKEIELAERAAELERKRQGVDKDGFRVDKDGNRIQIGVPTRAGVYEQAKGRGLDEGQSLQIANQFVDEFGKATGWEGTGKTWSAALNEAIEKMILENAAKAASKSTSESPRQQGQQQARPQQEKTTVVNINLNGKQKQVKTDPAGAQAIQEVLAGLETSSRTSA